MVEHHDPLTFRVLRLEKWPKEKKEGEKEVRGKVSSPVTEKRVKKFLCMVGAGG